MSILRSKRQQAVNSNQRFWTYLMFLVGAAALAVAHHLIGG